jgi:hypothetical protein
MPTLIGYSSFSILSLVVDWVVGPLPNSSKQSNPATGVTKSDNIASYIPSTDEMALRSV